MFNELSYELADVRTALKALEKRVDVVERLATSDSLYTQTTDKLPASGADAFSGSVRAPNGVNQVPNGFEPTTNGFDHVPHGIDLAPCGILPAPCYIEPAPQCIELAQANDSQLGQSEFSAIVDSKQSDESENLAQQSDSIKKEGLEVFVGRHLNKLGISFLVIGCALALVYQFQYFAPLLKVISGLIVGAVLILSGEKFEKNSAKMDWYGRALIGGGWALSYFSIFAAHHFDSVRVIESATVDVVLLFAVASGAIFHSLKYKSETITGITLTLAFATICLSPATSFSLLACTMLVAALVGLCFKMNWYKLFVYGECIFYAVYLRFILPQIMNGQNAFFGMNSSDGNFFTAVACSVFCWMAMNLVIFTTKELPAGDRQRLVVASLINCAAFVPTVLVLMTGAHESMKFGFLLTTGIAYLISTMTANKSVSSGPLSCNRILGLSLVTMAVPLKFTGDWMTAFWSLEVPVLVWAGLQFEMPSVRRFAGVLAIYAASVSFWTILFPSQHSFNSLVLGAIALTAYGVTAFMYEDHKNRHGLASRMAFHFYFAICAAITIAVLCTPDAEAWFSPGYILACALTILLGFKIADKPLWIAAEIAMFLFGVPLFFVALEVSSKAGIFLVVPTLLYIANEYHKRENYGSFLPTVYQTAAAAVFGALLSKLFSGFTLEVMFAFETLAIIICGFSMRSTSLKIVAFLASTCLALKFLFWDLNNAISIQLFGETVSMVVLYGIVCASTLLTTSVMYLSERLRSVSGKHWQAAFYAHAALTAMVVGALNVSQVSAHWLSIVLTMEGVSVLALGFKYKDKVLRVSGLLVLGLVISRLLFIELASIQTIYRILSFIGAGLVLLAASLAYAKMSNETAITKS